MYIDPLSTEYSLHPAATFLCSGHRKWIGRNFPQFKIGFFWTGTKALFNVSFQRL